MDFGLYRPLFTHDLSFNLSRRTFTAIRLFKDSVDPRHFPGKQRRDEVVWGDMEDRDFGICRWIKRSEEVWMKALLHCGVRGTNTSKNSSEVADCIEGIDLTMLAVPHYGKRTLRET